MENETSENYILHQEECKEKVKNLGTLKLQLHPAGGFDKLTGFVYEPIGKFRYLWKLKGYKGLSTAKLMGRAECASCGTIFNYEGERDKVKCSCGRVIDCDKSKWVLQTGFNNLVLSFDDKPLDNLFFIIPHDNLIQYWLNHDVKITSQQVFLELKKYFQTYFDFPFTEKESSILSLATIQSWLTEILDIVFYIAISGETGSGKTALGEALMLVSRHGVMASSISSAAIARTVEKFKLSLFFDEIDNKKHEKDEDISGILRQGYRKGNKYIKLQPRTFEPETFDAFGFKSFSFRSEVVDDLQNRSIESTLSKTKDKSLPVLNMQKKFNSPLSLLFFWYLDNIEFLFTQCPNFICELNELSGSNSNLNELVNANVNAVNAVNIVNVNIYNNNIQEIRNSLVLKTRFLLNHVNRINKSEIFGRNIEISYLLYSLGQMLGVDIDNLMLSVIEDKQEVENASEEEGWLGLLKQVLVKDYEDVFSKAGDDVNVTTYRKIMTEYIARMRELFNTIPSQYQIKRFLRQLGFVDGLNKKVVRINGKPMLCLVFDSVIKEKLGITIKEDKQGKQEKMQ